jgi:hypothetical protein
MEDRVVDLEDALDDLKAEFEKMMAGDDAGDDEESDDEDDMDMGDDEEGEEETEEESLYFGEADEDEVEESAKTAGETMREYVEKVTGKMGDNGANAKSIVAKPNNMGGTSGNIAQGADEKGGKAGAAKEDNAGNVNVPGAKASKSMKAEPKGHGADKKGAGETADNKKSVVGK